MAWADNKNFMLRQEAAGKATPSQKAWLAKWRAAGSPETQAGMSSPAPTASVSSPSSMFGGLLGTVKQATTPTSTDTLGFGHSQPEPIKTPTPTPTPTPEPEEDDGLYTMILHQETGDNAVSLFGATGEDKQALSWSPTQVTRSDLQEAYNDSTNLQNVFGSFDRYMAYIEESSDMIEAQDWFSQEGIDQTTAAQELQEEDDLAFGPGQQAPINDTQQSDANARQGAYASWMNSEENQALMNKYGIPTEEFTNEKGDRFRWTGTGFARTYKMNRTDFGDYVLAAGAAILMTAAPQLAAQLVATTGMSAASASALANATLSLASQAATTGDIDLNTVIQDTLEGAAGGLFGDAGEITSVSASDIVKAITDAINGVADGDFDTDYSDIVWQDVDITDVLGDLQIQIPGLEVTEETLEAARAAAAAAEETAAAEEAAAAAAEAEKDAEALKDYEEAAEQIEQEMSEAIAEGDFQRAEQIAKDHNEEYGEISSDITGEAYKDVEAFEEAYKDRETQAEQAEKEEEEQDNSGINVDWADYEIVGQREDGCYDVRQKSTDTVFVACPGDVVNGVAVDSGNNGEEVEDNGEDELTFGGSTTKNATEEVVEEEVVDDIFVDTTVDTEGGLTFGGATTKDTTEETVEETVEETEPEQKDKDAAETAKDIAEQLLKDSNDSEGGLTFGGAATKDDGGGDEVEEEPGDDEGETELEIALDPTKDGGGDGGEDPGDIGFTFGGGSSTKDTKDGTGSSDSEGGKDGTGDSDTEGGKDGTGDSATEGKDGDGSSDTEGPGEEPGDEGLTFGGGSSTKDTKDDTGSSDTEGKDGTGDSDTEGPGDKDGTGSSETEGPGEEEVESLFGLTKDAGSVGGSNSPLGFKPFTAGISYESPTIQNIIQSPNVDYMAQLNKIINKGMLV